MRILVTGGTGFLGRRLVEDLARRHEVALLVRPTSSREDFPDGVAFVEGDVTDRASLERAMAGADGAAPVDAAPVDAVVHAAALVKILAPAEAFDRVNVGGMENVLAARRTVGVPRLVYVSSFMALGPTEDGPGGRLDESAPAGDRDWINDYERTKTLADRLARNALEAGEPVSVVYPGVIYGEGVLTEGNIVVRHVLDLAHGRLPALLGRPERVWSYVHVEDVVAGLVAALEDAPPGRRWVLGGDNVSQAEFYRRVEELGVAVPRRRLPDAVAKAAGWLDKARARVFGGTPSLTPDLVEVYRHDWALDSSRAGAELGYRPRRLERGLAETRAWLEATGRWPGASGAGGKP